MDAFIEALERQVSAGLHPSGAAGHYDSILARRPRPDRWTDGAKIARVHSCRSDLN
jgi:hypothetical protein